jgi:hypothetical protein
MVNNSTTPTSFDALAVGRSSTNPFITVFSPRNPTSNDVNYPIQQRWYNHINETEYILTAFSVVNETKTAVWQPINASQFAATETLTGNSGGPIAVDMNNNINVIGDGTTINIVGNPGTNTLTASVVTGSVITETLTGNSGGAVSPTAGNINTLGIGSITIVGNPGTSALTTQLTGLTNHNVLVGAGTTTITKIAPSATSGVPLISQGAAADPLFGTAVVAGGGTGDTSFTAYAPIVGGTTTTGPLQSAPTGQSTSGFVFTSTGSGSLPTFQSIYTQGTFTPTLQFGGGSTGITYLSRTGLYTVIGNMLFFEAQFTLTSKGSSTGVAQVINLPFTANFGTSAFLSITQFTLPNTTTQIWGQINTGGTSLLCIYADSATGASVQMSNSNFMNNTAILFQGFYFLS